MAAAGALMQASGGLISAYGQIKAGDDAADALEKGAKIADQNAAEVEFATADNIRKLRVMGRKASGEMSANYGASGVQQTGSVIDVIAESDANVERDATSMYRSGKIQAANYRAEAQARRDAAGSAKESARYGAVGALLGAGGSVASSLPDFKTSKRTS